MPIRNEASVTYPDQAEIDHGDIQIMEMVAEGYWVISGGAVTAQGSPDGTVAVSAGTCRVQGSTKTISAGNVSVVTGSANPDGTTASAADATQARFSLITVNATAQLGVLHGTPAGLSPSNDGSYLCVFPAISGKVVLAAIFIPPAATTIASSQIEDKRIIGSVDMAHDQDHVLSGSHHVDDLATTQMPQLSAFSTYANLTSSTADPTTATVLYTPVTFTRAGTLVASTGTFRWYNDTGRTLTFASARATVTTVPTGASIKCDINVDGTTCFVATSQVNRPTIAISGNTNQTTTFDSIATVASGSYLTVDIDQVGSTIAGADLTVTIWMKG